MSKHFEIILFTASQRCYADAVVGVLDPARELIQHRFYREDCLCINGVHFKDLRVIGNRNLHEMLIVDNAPYTFAYQLDHGIPIVSWKDDPYDRELFDLTQYLKSLATAADMVQVNAETFKLRSYYADCHAAYFGAV